MIVTALWGGLGVLDKAVWLSNEDVWRGWGVLDQAVWLSNEDVWRAWGVQPGSLDPGHVPVRRARERVVSRGSDIVLLITFRHLADALVQSDLQEVQGHSPLGK